VYMLISFVYLLVYTVTIFIYIQILFEKYML